LFTTDKTDQWPRDVANSVGAAGQPRLVHQNEPHEFRKCQRGDREVVFPQLEGRKRHERRERGRHRYGRQGRRKPISSLLGQQRSGVGAHTVKPGKSKINHSGLPPLHIEREPEQNGQ
jgi:hypothetical protein